eukprot:COSAG06_NODE_50646_length_317_cov_0.908257_1_plen_23_part_10
MLSGAGSQLRILDKMSVIDDNSV